MEYLGQIVTVKVRSMCRCGDCVEVTNAKPEKVKGPEFWHKSSKKIPTKKNQLNVLYCNAINELVLFSDTI